MEFLSYDGINFPFTQQLDFILENGVFERLDKKAIESFIKQFVADWKIGGTIILYFLMERARGTEFTNRLGDSAYLFWNHDELEPILNHSNLAI